MAISFVGAAGAVADSVSLPAHQAGDLIIICAFRTALTAPSLPAGFTNINDNSANGSSIRMGYKIAASGAETSGTWTNATHTLVSIYRGAKASGPIGSAGEWSDDTNGFGVWTLGLTVTDGSSWVAGGFGHLTATDVDTPPAGLTARQAIGGGAPESVIFDTASGVASWGDSWRGLNATGGHHLVWFEILAETVWARTNPQPVPGLPWRAPVANRFDLRRGRDYARRAWTRGDGSAALNAVTIAALFPVVADTVDDLAATGLVTGAPVLGAPALGQTHGLTATALATGAPVTGAPALGQRHGLTATALATGAPVTATPALGTGHNLTATGIATGSPAVGTPAIGQRHALTATALATGAPVTGAPAIGQAHALAATGLATGSPVVGTPAVGQRHALTATAIATAAPAVGTPAIGQAHALSANALATDAPETGAPVLSEDSNTDVLTATSIAAGSPSVGSPALGQTHALTGGAVAAGAPAPGAPVLGQVHGLAAAGIAAGTPALATPALGQRHALAAVGIATAAPAVGLPAIGQRHAFTAVGIATGAPSVGAPELTSGAGLVNLEALGISAGVPIISVAFLNYTPPPARTVAASAGARRVAAVGGASTIDVPASGRAVIAPAEPRVTGPASDSRAARVP